MPVKRGIRFARLSELEKLTENSVYVVEILDARNPLGTRNPFLKKIVEKHRKKLIIALNKIDLIPEKTMWDWLEFFAYRGETVVPISARNRIGTLRLRRLLRETCRESKERCVGVVTGVPKTGKSTLVNILRGRHGASTSPFPGKPGYTRDYTFYRVEGAIYIYDAPGLPPNTPDWLEKMIRYKPPEEIKNPFKPAIEIIRRAQSTDCEGIERLYRVKCHETEAERLIEEIALRRGWREKKTGEPLVEEAARTIIRDYLSGRLNPFREPP